MTPKMPLFLTSPKSLTEKINGKYLMPVPMMNIINGESARRQFRRYSGICDSSCRGEKFQRSREMGAKFSTIWKKILKEKSERQCWRRGRIRARASQQRSAGGDIGGH